MMIPMFLLLSSIGFVPPLSHAFSLFPSPATAGTTTRRPASAYARPRLTRVEATRGNNDDDDTTVYDVAILGSGPASCSLAALLSAASPPSPNVVVLSKFADKRWVPNYGCWMEEWKALDTLYTSRGVPGLLEKGIDTYWEDTDCFFGEFDSGVLTNPDASDEAKTEGSYRRVVGRDYVRLSREGLKDILFGSDSDRNYTVIRQNVRGTAVNTNIYTPAGAIQFHPSFTELTLQDDSKIKAKIVVDGTGAESSFTIRDNRDKEGYQIAYGVECRVNGPGVTNATVGDYHRSKMTLFDFRSESWKQNMPNEKEVIQKPTFNYVMTLSNNTIFFEETSLVANPAMSFQECKDRLTQRLESQNVYITDIVEEEFCYIPMGGGLPRAGQRIIPIGAAAGLVHPATGYQVGRCFASNIDVADQILKELDLAKNDADFDPDIAAANVLGCIWTPEAIRQRNFAIFGGEFFMTLNVHDLKQFFAGFFALDPAVWGGFLAGWKYLPGHEYQKDWIARFQFAFLAIIKLPPLLALRLLAFVFTLSFDEIVALVQSISPIVGEPEEEYTKSLEFQRNKGDLAAKDEAMRLLCMCDRCEEESQREESNKG